MKAKEVKRPERQVSRSQIAELEEFAYQTIVYQHRQYLRIWFKIFQHPI